ncbi:MAG TPA: hypothetical protein VHB02_08030 [Acidimicrobiales bacterium]|nr:hypothetical protein [Acidimicrobiales bacterium]
MLRQPVEFALYAVADLVAAERLDPLMAPAPAAEVLGQDTSDRELAMARQELAVAQARIAELSAWITRTEGEVAFLRSLLANGRVA